MNRIAMGIWGITNLRDRFNINGFGDEVSVIDRIKMVGETEGIDGIELHLPTEIDDSNAAEIERVLGDYNLQMVQLCGHTWTERQYKFGALGHADAAIRLRAVDRVKAALDMGARFQVPISVLWPATDGNDFPLQTDYIGLYDRYVDSVRRILDHIHQNRYTTRLCIEPKPFEPRSYIMMGTTAQALCIVNEVNDPSFGINLDIGHSLIARENLEDQVSLIARYGKLFHTHFNDNDQQCDADLPPGTVNFTRLVSFLYVLDQMGYDGWFGLDLFPYRDSPVEFMKLSRDNLRLGTEVVRMMRQKGADELRQAGESGPEMARLVQQCIWEVGAPYPAVK
jgi:sugar phosphate isomerase/epimerase